MNKREVIEEEEHNLKTSVYEDNKRMMMMKMKGKGESGNDL